MSGMLRAGKLNRVVSLLAKGTGTDDGYTTKPGAFATIGKRRASVQPEYRPERLEALGQTGKAVIIVRVRSDSMTRSLTEEHGVRYKGDDYELLGRPIELGNNEGFELTAAALT